MTLDEEIRDLARNAVERLTLKVASNGEIDLVAERIRAGIEAWKRQEPDRQEIADLIFDIIKHGDEAHQGWLRLKSIRVAEAILAMSASLRTSEEGKDA